MNRKYFYYIVFGVTFLTFGLVQDYIRPNYKGGNEVMIYFLGVIPNFLPGIGLPSMFYVTIPEIFKPNTSIYRNRLKWSIIISMIGLIGNEFITIYTPGRWKIEFLIGMMYYNLDNYSWGNSFLFSTRDNSKQWS